MTDGLARLLAAGTVEAVIAAAKDALGLPGVEVQVLLLDPGSGQLLPGVPTPARVRGSGEPAAAEEPGGEGQAGLWVSLDGLGGPIGKLGVSAPTGALGAETCARVREVAPILALALDRVLAVRLAAVHRDAAIAVGDAAGVAFVLASDRAEILVFSPGMERLTGWTAEEVRTLGYFDCVYPDPEQRARAVVSTRQSFSGHAGVDVPWRLNQKDGTAVPCRLDSRRIVAPDGARYILAAFSRRSEEARHQAEDRASARHAELGRFAAAVNHDFNNLLAVAQGRAELLLGHADPVVRGHAQMIVEVGERAARLTRQLQAFARDQPLFIAAADIRPVCEEALRVYRAVEGAAAVMVSTAPDLPAVDIEPTAVRHLLLNLLQNAGEAAGRTGRVFVEVTRATAPESPTRRGPDAIGPHGWVRVRVSDNGPGFTREAREKLFEPFYTTKGVGRGLGLPAVGRIVEGLDAVLDVPFQVGRGAIVDVYLPVAGRVAPPEPTLRDPEVGGTERVWLVDDDAAVRDVLALTLEAFGYTVRSFEDPLHVLDAVDAGATLDLLVSDVVMPGMDGVELYRALRERGNACAVLFVSGYAKSRVDVPHEQKTDFAIKPVPGRVLGEKVRRLLNYVVPAP